MKETTNQTTTEKNKPAHKIRLGSVSATIWENAFEDGRTTYRAMLAKTYRDYKGNWQETTAFRVEDLILVSTLAQRAADWILAHEAE